MSTKILASLFALSFTLLSPAFAHDASKMTPDMRKKMADMHQKMAECLRSDRPISDCKKEMIKNCPFAKEGKHCPMMHEMDEMSGGGDEHSDHH